MTFQAFTIKEKNRRKIEGKKGQTFADNLLVSSPAILHYRPARERPKAETMGTALKSIQDKLAVEANDFQALQKGARASVALTNLSAPPAPSHNDA